MKEEIDNLIWEKMNQLRSSKHYSGFGRFFNTSTLQRIGNEIGLEHLNKVVSDNDLLQTANSPMQVIPSFLYDFIKLFVNHFQPKNLLDPWLTRDSYPIVENFENFRGITINQAEYNLITIGFKKDSNKVKLGDGLENINKEQNKFDLIVSFPPFVMSSRKANSTSKDYATDLLIESSDKLTENGKLLFLMPQKFLFDKRMKQAISISNISIDGVFYLEEGSHYPITSISTYLIVASKGENKSTLTGKLTSDKKSNEIIFKNFINKKEGVKIQLGKFIDYYYCCCYYEGAKLGGIDGDYRFSIMDWYSKINTSRIYEIERNGIYSSCKSIGLFQ